ncbi:hypothetical protein ElyMa_001100400 [Elysia marginata]|uniref:DNA-directed RNA polymerase n=1 Tax=Elysia marginata TaxID=1093978 RepID=A0AAV4HVD9_9GAST|nr:hypothetical protein ElyMa_001100400 [Elysia marginata]
MALLGIEPATSISRVRRANHSATLPLLYSLEFLKFVTKFHLTTHHTEERGDVVGHEVDSGIPQHVELYHNKREPTAAENQVSCPRLAKLGFLCPCRSGDSIALTLEQGCFRSQ